MKKVVKGFRDLKDFKVFNDFAFKRNLLNHLNKNCYEENLYFIGCNSDGLGR